MSGIKKEECSVCTRHVSFGTLYKRGNGHMCSWCKTSFEKGKRFNRTTRKWIDKVTEGGKQERKKKMVKWRLENITLRVRHFLGGQKEGKDLNYLSVSKMKAIEDFFLEE